MDELYGLKLDDLLKLRFYLNHIPRGEEAREAGILPCLRGEGHFQDGQGLHPLKKIHPDADVFINT